MIHGVVILLVFIISFFILWLFFFKVWFAVLACLFPMLGLMSIHGVRTNIFSGKRLGFLVAFKANTLAVAGSLFVPGRLDEIIKPLYFKKAALLSMTDGISVLLTERIYDLLMVLFLALGAFYFLPVSESTYVGVSKNAAISGFIMLLLVIVILVFFSSAIVRLLNKIPYVRTKKLIVTAVINLKTGLTHGLHPLSIVLTVIVWLGSYFLCWCFLQLDGGVELSAHQSLVVFLAAVLGLTITVTPGGLGTFEAMVAFLLQYFGYPLEAAFASAVGLRLVSFLPNTIFAVYIVMTEGFHFIQTKLNNR